MVYEVGVETLESFVLISNTITGEAPEQRI